MFKMSDFPSTVCHSNKTSTVTLGKYFSGVMAARFKRRGTT